MATISKGFSGKQKAAALLIALGPEISAQVLKSCKEAEIERVTTEIFAMKKISEDTKEDILQECYEMSLAHEYLSAGGEGYAREVLLRALGPQKAEELLNRLAARRRIHPFDFIRETDPVQLISFIQNEHPQTIALILSHLPPNQAGAILAGLDPGMQADIAQRIASMDRTAPEVVKDVENILKKKRCMVLSQDYTSVGGLEFLVKILNRVDRSTEKGILERLEESDSELTENIRKLMFVFEDIGQLDDRSLQRVLRDIDTKDLAMALKGSKEDLKERIFKNMSARAAEMLRDDIAVSGPVRLRAVEEAQQRIVNVVRRLDEAEEIVISRGGDDVIV
ncbi:MAG: flagellar motor switch protein FliG [Chloroflexi bacterium]|nr:flagellar motor switch protein FliG [Chloroflexota bacterium]